MTTTIKISSRASVKVGESFYTVEYTEERTVPPNSITPELEEYRAELWNTWNNEVDKQIEEIMLMYKK